MKITGYRSLLTQYDWGRLTGDANGVMPGRHTDVHVLIIETDDGLEGIGLGAHGDIDRVLARIAADPVSREWWTHTDPCQRRIADERVPGALWQPADEIWHLS